MNGEAKVRQLIKPSLAEDAAINRGIADDQDIPEVTPEMFATMRRRGRSATGYVNRQVSLNGNELKVLEGSDANTAITLAADIRRAYPGLEDRWISADAASSLDDELVSLLGLLEKIRCDAFALPVEQVFERAIALIEQAGLPVPVFDVLVNDGLSARVRTSSGREYALTFENGKWVRGYRNAASISEAMRGAK